MPKPRPDPLRIKRITESIIGLPTLPTVVSKMIELVDSPKTSATSLANLISTDQTITARILKMANSAYYGFSREVSTVNTAIVVMGFNSVKEMGLSLSVFDVFKDLSDTRHFDIAKYWEHSIGCGIGAKMMANRYQHAIVGEAFVAGLLHDIGKVILNQYLHTEFCEIMARVADRGEELGEVEMDMLGTRHGEIGGWLADKWRLPVMISESIRLHHFPWEADKAPAMVALVSLANYLCHRTHIGSSGRRDVPELDERVWETLQEHNVGLEAGDMEYLEEELLMEFDKTDTFLSLVQAEQ